MVEKMYGGNTLERIITAVLKEQYRKLLEEKPEVKLPEVPEIKPPEVKVPEVKLPEVPTPSIFFEPGASRNLSARSNRIFSFKNCRGTLFYFIMRSTSRDYKIYLTVDNRNMITDKTFSELEPDSAKIDWYMAYYDHKQKEYVFGLFKIMWENHFILIIEPTINITATIKYSGIKV